MACQPVSSKITNNYVRVRTTEVDVSLIQKADVIEYPEYIPCPKDIPPIDKENSSEERYSCVDETVAEDEYEDDDTRFLDVCKHGDIEDLVQLLEEMAQAGETLSVDMLNYSDITRRVSKKVFIC